MTSENAPAPGSEITLRVNGKPHTLYVDHRRVLLDLLREDLGLTGAKKGCDHGQCGACTVLAGGRRLNSCLLPAVTLDGAEVTTVQGLGGDGEEPHPLQRAFLDVPSPSWMRAPGESPGRYAPESVRDELAEALAVDPVQPRIRNEPEPEPGTGMPFRSRHLVRCPREGLWLLGTGVAAATYPASATARALPDGTFEVRIDATDIGTGARTVLARIATRLAVREGPLPPDGLEVRAAAIGNAVHHATGVRCRELTLTPDRILAGLPAAG